MNEFLSSEWLEANLFNAEAMPDDHEIKITGEEWFALLMEIHRLRKSQNSAFEKILHDIHADVPPDFNKYQGEHVGFMHAKTHAMEAVASAKE